MSGGVSDLAERLRGGERRALAQAITLVESTLPEQRAAGERLLAQLLPLTGGSHRVALSGAPGAGKSTLVDALGMAALQLGRRVAVLAIDQASAISGGSLLGDAVRMSRLAASEGVFVRASSNAGTLGGTAPATREAVLLCEAAGFELLLIETVGVGQAEQSVRDVCDTLVVLALPGAGDEIQAMKRGLLEVADAVLVSKADGAAEPAARAFVDELGAALSLLRPRAAPHVAPISAKTGLGVSELLRWLDERSAGLRASGELVKARQQQLRSAFNSAVSRELAQLTKADPRTLALSDALEQAVVTGGKLPSVAARELLAQLLPPRG